MKTSVVKGLKALGKGIRSKSTLLLTIGSVAGVGAVVLTTANAAVKADRELGDMEWDAAEEGTTVSKKEKAKVYAKHYWPVLITAGGTTACIIFNHKINTDKIKTVTAAYEFYREAYVTYKEKVREKLGESASRELDADIVMDKVKRKYPDIDPALIPGSGIIFVESMSGQIFRGSVDEIMKEAKYFNEDLVGMDWLSLNEWLVAHLRLNPMDPAIGDNLGFAERYGHDGLNIKLTPSNLLFATGETATAICYEDELVAERDYTSINAM